MRSPSARYAAARRASSSARRCSVTSTTVPTYSTGRPAPSNTGCATVWMLRTVPSDVKREVGTASVLKDGRVVFNIAGNKYRIVVWIN